MHFNFPAIGIIHSCFKEKFGIPRQPGLAPLAEAHLELLPPYNDLDALEGLSGCSHIWVQFVFHANNRQEWKPKVKPPRLGGNKTMGVFATRSPVRPAPIGLSVVKLVGITAQNGTLLLTLSGVDFLDGTPVLDIKPYVPYVDKVLDATNEFAAVPPAFTRVCFSQPWLDFCADYERSSGVHLQELIRQVLQQDPRPQYQKPSIEKIYGMKLLNLNICWRYLSINGSNDYEIVITEIQTLS